MANLQVGVAGNGTVTVGAGASVHSPASNTLTLGSNNAERFRITGVGSVGIGTDDPVLKLHLHTSDSGNNYLKFTNATTGTLETDGVHLGLGSDEAFNINQRESNDIRLFTAATERLRIDSSGYVGVGEDSPATILHVKANVGDLLRLDRNNTGAVGNQIAFRHSNSGTLTETGSINCVSTANAATGELRFYTKASNIKGDTSQILIELLERRLDAIVYRMKFVPTIFAARQLVNHGHVKVNGKRVNIPSYSVKDGDEISLKDGSKEINIVQESIVSQEREIPEYIEVDIKEFKGKFLRAPLIHDVPYPVTMEPNLVIEFYSR